MIYSDKFGLIKIIPLVSDFVERLKIEIMKKIICSAKLLLLANINNGIAKIDIIKVLLTTHLLFSIQKLNTLLDKFTGNNT